MSIDEPGAASQPEDIQGDGPVTLSDRTEPGGQGSPDTNQAKTEPMAPTPDHPEPLAAPDLDSMNVGGADPQAPRHPDALRSGTSATGSYSASLPGQEPTHLSGPGTAPDARPQVDTPGADAERALPDSGGTAHHAPGLQGSAPDGESVTTDVHAGAARMGPQALDSTAGESPGQGDDQTVPSSGTSPLPGSSQEHHVVHGVRLPEE